MDATLTLRDSRNLAWHEWGVAGGTPVLRLQGTPGSRLSRHPRLDVWERLGLRVVMTDRPGFGRSTRLPGRGVSDVADDLVELLDHLGLDSVPVLGQSGGGPHVLGLAARHPERVRAATVVVGAAPLADADLPHLVGLNAEAYRRIRGGGWGSLHALLAEQRLALLADPLAGLRRAMQGAPDSDWAVMADPVWQGAFAHGVREALRAGAEGWTDESIALLTEWDFAPEEVSTPVVWWHAWHNANVPPRAVERVTGRLPSVDLRVWDGCGHLESFHREQDVLADLLARAHKNCCQQLRVSMAASSPR